jgi:DNA-directed RNA polymerase beta subunit
MTNSKLYYEAHVTLEPVYEDSPKAAVLRRIAVKFDFRVADLLMKKRSIDTPERSMFDSFLTTRHPDFDVVKARVFCAVTALKDEGFDVWRFKIDRKRKIPVTTLLRALGMTEASMKEAFKHVDQAKDSFLQSTLDKDPSKGHAEALIEVYRRLRPGDLATVDNARSLLENMFYNFKRFDFSRVGRYKINQRLGLDVANTAENRIMRLEDLVAIVAELIRMNVTQEPGDDVI